MFPEMRRNEKNLTEGKLNGILRDTEWGTLAVIGENGYPSSYPVNFVYDGERRSLYFHHAPEGYMLECLKHCHKVCFSVVGRSDVVPDKFTTLFESVMAYGSACVVDDENEKVTALSAIAKKFSPGFLDEGEAYIQNGGGKCVVIRIDIEHMTAKGRES